MTTATACAPARVFKRRTRRGAGPDEFSVLCACGHQTPWRASKAKVTELYAGHLAEGPR